MNQNYVRKCEEYLQNIPTQRRSTQQQPAGHRQGATSGAAVSVSSSAARSQNLSSRKLTQQPTAEQAKQSINNPPGMGGISVIDSTTMASMAAGVPGKGDAAAGRAGPKPHHHQAMGPTALLGRQQGGSKFIRPCCHQPQNSASRPSAPRGQSHVDSPARAGGRVGGGGGAGGGDNVNQSDNSKQGQLVVESDADYGRTTVMGHDATKMGKENGRTETWSRILTPTAQMKSKTTDYCKPGPTMLQGLTTSITSINSSLSRPASSVAAIPPQPRPSLATLAPPSSSAPADSKSSESEAALPPETNLFQFDPLRTLQFLTLELKSKLKPLCPEQKQLYRIAKELLLAVKILTERSNVDRTKCENCEKHPVVSGSDKAAKSCPAGSSSTVAECLNCSELRNTLEQQNERHAQQVQLLNEEINYLQARRPLTRDEPSVEVKALTDQHQRLAEEIKRLQALIGGGDKQTLEGDGGLIGDLNRKLQEASDRCRRLEQAKNDAEKQLLYATLENERLNFLLSSHSSTMTNLKKDFSAIQALANQQIDLLDHTPRGGHSGTNGVSPSTTRRTATAIIDNHHRNYRHPSGSMRQPPPTTDTSVLSPWENTAAPAAVRNTSDDGGSHSSSSGSSHHRSSSSSNSNGRLSAEKVRKQRRHYSFKNVAEKESDDGNDANDLNDSRQEKRNPAASDGITSATDGQNLSNGDGGPTAAAADGNPDAFRAARQMGHNHKKSAYTYGDGAIMPTAAMAPPRQGSMRSGNNDDSVSPLSDVVGGHCARAVVVGGGGDGGATSSITGGRENDDGYSKTNDCASPTRRRPQQQQQHRQETASHVEEKQQQQLGPGNPSWARLLPVAFGGGDSSEGGGDDGDGEEKYPRDYGDKFERRESCLLPLPPVPGKELCQNRPIIGQIRNGNQWQQQQQTTTTTTERMAVDVVGVETQKQTNSGAAAANEPASGGKEEFSIDFDDITLPCSPRPFEGRSLSSITLECASLILDDE